MFAGWGVGFVNKLLSRWARLCWAPAEWVFSYLIFFSSRHGERMAGSWPAAGSSGDKVTIFLPSPYSLSFQGQQKATEVVEKMNNFPFPSCKFILFFFFSPFFFTFANVLKIHHLPRLMARPLWPSCESWFPAGCLWRETRSSDVPLISQQHGPGTSVCSFFFCRWSQGGGKQASRNMKGKESTGRVIVANLNNSSWLILLGCGNSLPIQLCLFFLLSFIYISIYRER